MRNAWKTYGKGRHVLNQLLWYAVLLDVGGFLGLGLGRYSNGDVEDAAVACLYLLTLTP